MSLASILQGILEKYGLTWPLTTDQVEELAGIFTFDEFAFLVQCTSLDEFKAPSKLPTPSATSDFVSRVALLRRRLAKGQDLWHPDDLVNGPVEDLLDRRGNAHLRNGHKDKDSTNDFSPENN